MGIRGWRAKNAKQRSLTAFGGHWEDIDGVRAGQGAGLCCRKEA